MTQIARAWLFSSRGGAARQAPREVRTRRTSLPVAAEHVAHVISNSALADKHVERSRRVAKACCDGMQLDIAIIRITCGNLLRVLLPLNIARLS
jgi:hypothetical protein